VHDASREPDAHERSGAARRHRDRDRRVVALGGFLDDRESQSAAVAGGSRAAVEALEDAATLGFGNADTAVLDADERAGAIPSAPNRDGAARRRVAKRVVDQIVEYLGQQTVVTLDVRRGEIEAEVDVAVDRRRDPLRADALGERREIDHRELTRIGQRLLGTRQRKEPVRQPPRTQHRIAHFRERLAQRRRLRSPQLELELHLQACKRRSELMRGVGEEAALRIAGLADALEKSIERDDRRPHFGRRLRDVHGAQIVRRALQQIVAKLAQRRQPMAHAEPDEHDGGSNDQRRRHETGEDHFPHETIPLVRRLRDVDFEAVVRPHRRDAQRAVRDVRVVEDRLALDERLGRRGQVARATREPASAGVAHLEEDAVGSVEEQRLLLARRQRELRTLRTLPHVLHDVHHRIEQCVVVGVVRDAHRDEPRHEAAEDQDRDERHRQRAEQPRLDAADISVVAHVRVAPKGSRSRARCG